MSPVNKASEIFNVNGIVAVITGGGSGIGAYAARALDANGAKKVYIIGRRKESLEATAKSGVRGTITPIVGDVTSKETLTKIVEQVKQEQGHVNFLFANAGVMGPVARQMNDKDGGGTQSVQSMQKTLWESDSAAFTNTYHVNATAVFYTAVAFMDLLDAGNKAKNVAQDSQILVTSSVAGFSRYMANSIAYSVSKAGTTHLVKMLSTLFAQQGFHIRVNLIAPGLYPSEMTDTTTANMGNYSAGSGHESAFEGAKIMPTHLSPSERTGSEEDIAGVILFLASRAGAYMNGETLVTDGGRLAQLPSSY